MTGRRTLARPSLRLIGLAVYVGVNIGLTIEGVRFSPTVTDWQLWKAMPEAIASGHLHHPHHALPFVWSPVAGWIMASVSYLGYVPWVAIHFGALFLLRDWRLIGLVLASWGFWADASQGNVFIFIFVAGALALRGSRGWSLGYLTLLFLMPRPVQLPLAAWLFWKRSDLRLPTLGIFVAHAAIVLASGYATDWMDVMLNYEALGFNIGPSFFLGSWWLAAGIPLGIWLTLAGHVGWAGLAVSPYWLPQYLLMPLTERHPKTHPHGAAAARTESG